MNPSGRGWDSPCVRREVPGRNGANRLLHDPLLALATAVLADEVKGKVKSITGDKREFTVTDNDGKTTSSSSPRTAR
jgi:hypothetical protein